MKYFTLMAAIALVVALISPLGAQEEDGKVVLARVNERVITELDVNKLLGMTGESRRLESSYHGEKLEEEMRVVFRKALAVLIDEAVVEINATLDGIKLDDSDQKKAQGMMEENAKKFGTQENYELLLKESGLSVKDIKKTVHGMLLRQKYLQGKLSVDTYVSPKEAREYYEKNKSSFARRKTVTYRQILIKFGDANRGRDAAIKLMDNIRGNLKKGADFGALARQFSEGPMKDEGGLWPPVPPKDLRKNIADAIAGLKKGEVSKTIERESDLLLIKIEKSDDTPFVPFEQARAAIVKMLSEKKRQEKYPELEKKFYERVEIELLHAAAEVKALLPDSARVKGSEKENQGVTSP